MQKQNSGKAQGALEYLLLIGGAILIVAIILVIIVVSAHTMQCKAESNNIRAQMAQFEGLVGFWRFDEGSTTAKDYSYYENDGTYSIGMFSVELKASNCPNDKRASFKSPSSPGMPTPDYVEIPHLDAYYNPDGYTVAAWFKLDQLCSTTCTAAGSCWFCVIVEKNSHMEPWGNPSGYEAKFALGNSDFLLLRAWVERPSSPGLVLDVLNQYTAPVNDTTNWHFGAAVFDGTNYDPPKIIVYLDGVAGDSDIDFCGPAGDCPLQSGDIVKKFDGPIFVGTNYNSPSSNGTYEFPGQIDEVMWFNRPLSAGEIKRIYDLTKKQYQS